MTSHWRFVGLHSIFSLMGPPHFSTGSWESGCRRLLLYNLWQYESSHLISFLVLEELRRWVCWLQSGESISKDTRKRYIISIIVCSLYSFSFSYLCVLFNITLHINYLAAIGWMSLSNFIYSILLILHYFKNLLMNKILKQNHTISLLRVTR